MKTAEEWIEETTGSPKCRLTTIGACSIEEIQLDAMKEGMRRAAEIARWKHPISSSAAHYEAKRTTESILTTAEQLTIKDLEV